MKLSGTYFVIFILWKEILAESSTISLEKPAETGYFHGLINYLKNESKLYRLVFILENTFEILDPMLNSLMKEVNQNFPSSSINYNEISTWDERYNRYREVSYRSTSLFVFQVNNDKRMNLVGEDLFEINSKSDLASPRCLIMNSSNSTHEFIEKSMELFRYYKYFDITIMTYDENHQVTPFLSHISPATNTFSTQDITLKTQWFPDKVNNIKDQKWNFFSPGKNDEFQKNRSMMKIKGNIFVRVMLANLRRENKIVYSSHLECYLGYSFMPNLYNLLRIQKIDVVKAVIPRTEMIANDLDFSPQLLQMILGTVGTVIIIGLITFFMKFNRETWETLNIVQIIFGMPANQEPKDSLERIIFGSLLIACTVYTGFIYSVILDIGIQPVPEISTLEELADSSLIPRINFEIHSQITQHATSPSLKKLLAKTEFFPLYDLFAGEKCLEYLTRYKNISCILSNAESYVNAYLSSKGEEVNIKILPEIVGYRFIHWTANEKEPFSDFYNKIILRASEFGLFDKYYSVNNVVTEKISPPEEMKQEKLFFIISHVLGFGYSLSIISFLFELFIRIFKNRLNAFYTSFRLGN